MSGHDVTGFLEELRNGNREAFNPLLSLLYKDLRRIAGRYLRDERDAQTLQPTALVHEAYLRLVQRDAPDWESRVHFLNAAAQAMRRILVDHARARRSDKRGGGETRMLLDEVEAFAPERDVDLVALDEALGRLDLVDPQLGRIVELRYFGGLTAKEIAAVLGVSPATIDRGWTTARAWLRNELGTGAAR